MTLTTKEKWDVFIGVVGALFAGLSIVASVLIYQYGNDAAIQKEYDLIAVQSRTDYRRQLWHDLRATYKALAQNLGRMAAELDATGKISDGTRSDFNAAYWGTLILVETEDVQCELVKLRNDLRDLEHGRVKPEKIKLRIDRIVTRSKHQILRSTDDATN